MKIIINIFFFCVKPCFSLENRNMVAEKKSIDLVFICIINTMSGFIKIASIKYFFLREVSLMMFYIT